MVPKFPLRVDRTTTLGIPSVPSQFPKDSFDIGVRSIFTVLFHSGSVSDSTVEVYQNSTNIGYLSRGDNHEK